MLHSIKIYTVVCCDYVFSDYVIKETNKWKDFYYYFKHFILYNEYKISPIIDVQSNLCRQTIFRDIGNCVTFCNINNNIIIQSSTFNEQTTTSDVQWESNQKKKRYDENTFISYEQVLNKLVVTQIII